MKILACEELVPGCPTVVRAESEAEIVQIAAQHAAGVHGLIVDDQLIEAVKDAIREDANEEPGRSAE